MIRTLTIFTLAVFYNGASSLLPTTTPPLLDVPTYSLATIGTDGRTSMNILTYASPVGVSPQRMWAISLYDGTLSHENFRRTGKGVLQMLQPEHSVLVKLFGGCSGRDVDKKSESAKYGFPWKNFEEADDDYPNLVLPNCSYYLKLKQVGDLVNAGNHDVAICNVESMFVEDSIQKKSENSVSSYLSTGYLRKLGIISEQGRVI